MVLELGCVGAVGCVDDLALKGDEDLGFAGCLEVWQVE